MPQGTFFHTTHFSHLFTIHLFPFFRYNYRKRNASICLAYLRTILQNLPQTHLMGLCYNKREKWNKYKKRDDKKLVEHKKRYNSYTTAAFWTTLWRLFLYRFFLKKTSSYVNICICSFSFLPLLRFPWRILLQFFTFFFRVTQI